MQGKIVVITGSTSGIGLGIAKHLAKNGASIVLNGLINPQDVEEVCKQVLSCGAADVYFHPADLSKQDQIDDLFDSVISRYNKVDILVNNAGIQYVSPIEEFPVEKWEQIIRINLISSFYTIRRAIPLMKKHKYGRIINIASAHALVASPFKSAYVASKHGIVGMTKSVALEVAQEGITVNAICPGYADTPLVRNQIADTAKARKIDESQVINDVMLKLQATKKFIAIDEIAALVEFLCTEKARSITGSSLSIDGGWTAQ